MIASKENPLAGVGDEQLRIGWENADNTPGGYGKVSGVRGSFTKGQIAVELRRRFNNLADNASTALPVRRRGRKIPVNLLDYSFGMRAINKVGMRRARSIQ